MVSRMVLRMVRDNHRYPQLLRWLARVPGLSRAPAAYFALRCSMHLAKYWNLFPNRLWKNQVITGFGCSTGMFKRWLDPRHDEKQMSTSGEILDAPWNWWQILPYPDHFNWLKLCWPVTSDPKFQETSTLCWRTGWAPAWHNHTLWLWLT
jgi:hypothetical protein